MKRFIDSHDAKCENGLMGAENRSSDIPIWSNLMFGFPQNEWNNLTCDTSPQKVSKLSVATNNNCFHIYGEYVITFKVPYYSCGKSYII